MHPQKHHENVSKPVPSLLHLTPPITVLPRHSETKIKRDESLHTYHLLSPPINESVEYRTRHPTDLLWLPYILLTLILTSLLVISFIHFHCKNGHKYQRRRTPSAQTGRDWRQKIVENALMTNQATSVDLYGALRSWTSDPDLQDDEKPPPRGLLMKSGVTNYTTPIRTVRETADQYSSEFGLNFHRIRPARTHLPDVSSSSMKVGEKDTAKMQGHVTSSKNNLRSSASVGLYPILTNSPTVTNKITCASGGGVVCSAGNCIGDNGGVGGGDDRKRSYRSGGGERGRGVRTAQEYVTNRNGSMVNMRCGRPENVITFQDINRNIKRPEPLLRTPVVGVGSSRRVTTADVTKLSTIANISSNQTGSFSSSRDVGEHLGGRPCGSVGDGRNRAGILGEGRDGGAKALYSATKICRMDGTDDDWRVLQAHSQL